MPTSAAPKRSRVKIYYGPPGNEFSLYWTVKVKDAARKVNVDGTIADALAGTPGVVLGCHLSRVAKRNAATFPHPCIYVAVTKSMAYVVTKITNGTPSHAVRYKHGYSDWVHRNDTDRDRAYVLRDPSVAERQFTLYPPQQQPSRPSSIAHGGTGDRTGRRTGDNSAKVWKGCLARATDAGLINVPADALRP